LDRRARRSVFAAYRFTEPDVGVSFGVPEQMLSAGGSARPVTDAAALLAHLRRHRGLEVHDTARVTLGGRPALQAAVSAAEYRGAPPVCDAPCAAVAGAGPVTMLVEQPTWARITLVDVGGRVLMIHEDGGRNGARLRVTGAYVRTLRWR
jgi:hypothetical protein